MGCASSAPKRFDSPSSGQAVKRPPRGSLRSSARSESTEYNAPTSNDSELPGAVLEYGDVITSSRLRARPPRSSTRDLTIAPESIGTTRTSPDDTDLPNTVPEPDGISAAEQAAERVPASAPVSQEQTGDKPTDEPAQKEGHIDTLVHLPGEAAQTSLSGAPSAAGSTNKPVQLQWQPSGVASASAAAAADAANAEPKVTGVVLEQLLARASAPPPVTDGRKLVLIVWDIEHVRCPQSSTSSRKTWKHPLSPQNVLGYMKQHFIYSQGRMEYRTVAALSEASLRTILKFHQQFVELAVPNLSLLLAAKTSTSAVILKEVRRFMEDHAHIARESPGQLTIVFIARDDHFVDVRQEAADAGFAVEMLAQREWVDFLRRLSGQRTVKLIK